MFPCKLIFYTQDILTKMSRGFDYNSIIYSLEGGDTIFHECVHLNKHGGYFRAIKYCGTKRF
jgi:hypothetical protein